MYSKVKVIILLINLFAITSCKEKQNDSNTFLNYKLGMPFQSYWDSTQVLLSQQKIQRLQTISNHPTFLYVFKCPDNIEVESEYRVDNKYGIIETIYIHLGHPTVDPDKLYTTFDAPFTSAINSLFELYKSKYGNPDPKQTVGKQIFRWDYNQWEISFNKGEERNGRNSGATIIYSLNDEEMKKLEDQELNKVKDEI